VESHLALGRTLLLYVLIVRYLSSQCKFLGFKTTKFSRLADLMLLVTYRQVR
jgi:hypothetical protein